jgi:hypothetical protein
MLFEIHVAISSRLFDTPMHGNTAGPGYKAIGRRSRTTTLGGNAHCPFFLEFRLMANGR